MPTSHAFSLVELSIVLVILGLLTGGVLTGQSLIRAAELRAIISEYERYATATQTFRNKYMAIPGDMREATRFWERQSNSNCTSNVSPAPALNTASGTCDGDGNGTVAGVAAANRSSEIFQFWRQLSLAGLVEGNYTGLSGGNASGYQAVPGDNSPRSRLSNAGWAVNFSANGTGTMFNLNYGNFYYFGAPTTTSLTSGVALKPEELWNIDTKLDDGRPGRGKVIARNIATCTDAADENALDAKYSLTTTTAVCAMHIIQAF